MTWVVILNSNECRIFSFSKKNKELVLLKEISHPENKGRNEDLVSDRPGHYNTNSRAGGAYAQHTDPKDVKIDQFILEINKLLDESRLHQQYEKLIIIAAPKMYGHLMQHMDKNVEKLITQHIQKDLVFFKEHEALDFLMHEVR
jgi:protein required for attachment to host cells